MSNLRTPSDPQWAADCLEAVLAGKPKRQRASGYMSVSVKGGEWRHMPFSHVRAFLDAGNSPQEAARYFGLSEAQVFKIKHMKGRT
ncbi:MAG: hypothetical protein AAGF20_00185 [Pseudomonadota bacterium]